MYRNIYVPINNSEGLRPIPSAQTTSLPQPYHEPAVVAEIPEAEREGEFLWTADAIEHLLQVPEGPLRDGIRSRIEGCAREEGVRTINRHLTTQVIEAVGRSGILSANAVCPPAGEKQREGKQTVQVQGANADIPWTEAAIERLQRVPDFVRPFAKSRIEQFAAEKGYTEITPEVMAEARKEFGM